MNLVLINNGFIYYAFMGLLYYNVFWYLYWNMVVVIENELPGGKLAISPIILH